MRRRKSREAALQALYQAELSGETLSGKSLFKMLDMDESGLNKASLAYGETLFKGVVDNLEVIDSLMEEYSENWTIERMAVVDRNILRLALYELTIRDDVPYKVAIDEAIELAKEFSSDESAAFINGVLDKIAKDKVLKKKDAAT
ncbi:MAG: transcription antitermination factor NusB [Thermodesulfobacteriota bacterium]